jgi:uncharacterized membrane protein
VGINQSLWLDEATSGIVARDMDLSQLFTFVRGDFHPPLYYLLLSAWGRVFGYSEISLRMPSVIFAIGTIYFLYLIVENLRIENSLKIVNCKLKISEVAALFLATSGLHVYYSQEARMYAMSAFLVTAIVYLFLRLLRQPSKKDWLIFALLLPLNFITDYLPSLILPAIWLVAILKRKGVDWWRQFLFFHLPLLVTILVWLPFLVTQLRSGMLVAQTMPGWWVVLGGATLKNLALLAVKFSIGRISFDNQLVYIAVAGSVLALEGWILMKTVKRNWMWWLLFLLPIGLAFLLAFEVHVFSYFRLLFVLPIFYILLAAGAKRWWPILFAFSFLCTMYYVLCPVFHREDWRGLVRTIENDSSNFAFVLPTPNQREALYYYQPNFRLYYSPLKNPDFDKVYLMRYVAEIVDPHDLARQEIEGLGYHKVRELNFNGVVVWEYLK